MNSLDTAIKPYLNKSLIEGETVLFSIPGQPRVVRGIRAEKAAKARWGPTTAGPDQTPKSRWHEKADARRRGSRQSPTKVLEQSYGPAA
jgi:hypothetical protein